MKNLGQLFTAFPEFIPAALASGTILFSAVLLYLGLSRFLRKQNVKSTVRFPASFFGLFVLSAGAAFFRLSPLADHLPPLLWRPFLALTAFTAAYALVVTIDLFLVEYYLLEREHVYISPPVRMIADILLFVTFAVVLLERLLRFNPLALVALPTIMTAGIAFALQDTLKAFVAGIGLGRLIRLGDWISFQDKSGQVIDINWARTVIRTPKGDRYFIPNSQLQTACFLNYSVESSVRARTLTIGVSSDAPPQDVKTALGRCLKGVPGVSKNPEPWVQLSDFGDSAVEYTLNYWIDDLSRDAVIEDAVATRIWYALKEDKMALPCPTRILLIQRPKSGDSRGGS